MLNKLNKVLNLQHRVHFQFSHIDKAKSGLTLRNSKALTFHNGCTGIWGRHHGNWCDRQGKKSSFHRVHTLCNCWSILSWVQELWHHTVYNLHRVYTWQKDQANHFTICHDLKKVAFNYSYTTDVLIFWRDESGQFGVWTLRCQMETFDCYKTEGVIHTENQHKECNSSDGIFLSDPLMHITINQLPTYSQQI